MIANLGDRWYRVVNAAAAAAALAHLQEHLYATCSVELASARALLAIQGPNACAALSVLVPAVAAMRFMDAGVFTVDAPTCFIPPSGYSGAECLEESDPGPVAVH